jgi:TonB family protein
MRPVQMAVLLSSVLVTASAFAVSPKTDAIVNTRPQHVSTGVVAPVLLDANSFRISGEDAAGSSGEVTLSLKVDEKGNAQNVHVVKSGSALLDAKVVAAVLQSHFSPATLNNQAIPLDMALTVKVR